MQITVWSDFSKKRNSTKRPDDDGIEIDVFLKEDTSIENPKFIIAEPLPEYTYIAAFGHYYFVDDVINLDGYHAEIRCSQDTLATYKDVILNTSAMILYDTDANTTVTDSRLSVSTAETTTKNSVKLRNDISTAGSVIVSLTGTDAVGSYVIPMGNIARLVPDISDTFDSIIGSGREAFDAIRGGLLQLVGSGSVSENIRDVRWVPFVYSGDRITSLKAGMYDLGIGGSIIETRLNKQTVTVNIPWQFSDWRNCEPYTQVYMYIPFVGLVNYPANQLQGLNTITIETSLDKVTGDIAIMVSAGNQILGTYGASTGVSIPVGRTSFGAMNVVNSLMTGAASAVTGGIAGVAGAVSSTLNMLQPNSQTVGGISSAAGAGLSFDVQCMTVCHNTTTTPSSVSAVMGTPSYKIKTIGNLSGYCQCVNASIEINGRSGDRDAINSFLNGGFFIE